MLRPITLTSITLATLFLAACGSSSNDAPTTQDATTDSSGPTPDVGLDAHDASTLDGADTKIDTSSADSPDSFAHDADGASDTAIGHGTSCSDAIDVNGAIGGSMPIAAGGPSASDPSSCKSQLASKTYLSFDATAGNYKVTVTSAKGSSDPSSVDASVSLRSTCTDESTELSCNARAAFLDTFVGVSSPRRVFIVADGAWFASGFTVSITSMPSCFDDTDCASYGAGTTCYGGTCLAPLVCPSGKGDCDGVYDNGCESDLQSSKANCGACGRSCGGAHSSGSSCSGGTCTLVCDAGWTNCTSGSTSDCAVNTDTDPSNCGSCGKFCSSGSACDGGACTAAPTSHGDIGTNPRELLGDTSTLWMLDAIEVLRFDLATDKATEICMPVNDPVHLAMNTTTLFWTGEFTSGGTVASLPKSTTTLTTATILSTDPTLVSNLILADDAYVYFVGQRMPVGGGTVVDTYDPPADARQGFVQDATNFYFAFGTGTAGLQEIARSTTDSSAFTKSVSTTEIDVSDVLPANVLAVTNGYIYAAAKGAVQRYDKSTGAVTKFSTGLNGPSAIASDGTSAVYFAAPTSSSSSIVYRWKDTDATAHALATSGHVPAMAFAAGKIYWASGSTMMSSP